MFHWIFKAQTVFQTSDTDPSSDTPHLTSFIKYPNKQNSPCSRGTQILVVVQGQQSNGQKGCQVVMSTIREKIKQRRDSLARWGEGNIIFTQGGLRSLSDKGGCTKTPEGREEASHVGLWEVGCDCVCQVQGQQGQCVVTAEWARGGTVGDEDVEGKRGALRANVRGLTVGSHQGVLWSEKEHDLTYI